MKKLLYIPLLTIAITISSCKKLVDLQPENSVPSDVALQDVNGYQALLISVYDRLQDFGWYGRDFAVEGDVLADNAFVSSANGTRYLTNNTNTRGATYNIWTNAYAGINELNTLLTTIDALTVIGTSQTLLKQQVKSEAYALRGLIYFDLARVYGFEPNTIPPTGVAAGFDKSAVIRLTPTLTNADQTQKPRSTITDTYTQVEKDLTTAIANFKALAQLPGYTKLTSPFRVTESATHALLGKVYLYERKYTDASTEFDNALNSTIVFAKMAPAGGYIAAFKAIPNPESLLEITFNQAIEFSGVTGVNNSLYSYTQPSSSSTGNYNGAALSTFGTTTASAELLALFGTDDNRKAMFFASRSSATSAVFTWVNKYSGAGGSYTDDVPVIRYSDVVLMKAEALANLGQYSAAAALVVSLRVNRNAITTIVPTDATILNFIQDERRRELFFEGHRFFDLKRLGNGITKPAATAVGTIPASDYRLLAPLPSAEVALNPNLPNNPNY